MSEQYADKKKKNERVAVIIVATAVLILCCMIPLGFMGMLTSIFEPAVQAIST